MLPNQLRIAIWIALIIPSISPAADRLELIRYIPLWDGSKIRSPDTAGIAYHASNGQLIISDSEISEYGDLVDFKSQRIFQAANVFATDLALKTLHQKFLVEPEPGGPSEPVGITYSPVDGAVYVTDDDRNKIYRYPYNENVRFGPPTAEISTSADGSHSDPEGITCDPVTGELFVVSGTQEEKILRYRFNSATNRFILLGTFPISDHIRDPEGIACDPMTRNLFLVSDRGIAEFTQQGKFVQFFDYSFLEQSRVRFRLPGGGTFAPSSDPNDSVDVFSLYVTCRGIDNDQFPKKNSLDGGVAELGLAREPRLVSAVALAGAIKVPADVSSIQKAITKSKQGQVILVAPGTYRENLSLSGKTVQLVSEFVLTGDESKIAKTIIDGGGSNPVIEIPHDAKVGTRIIGLTIRNGDDGILSNVPFDILHCHVTDCNDGIDYEGGGGLIRACKLWENRGDAIDLDNSVQATIEFCYIIDNGNDGIEIRMHPHAHPMLDIVIRNNSILRNREDGIQLIGYEEKTARQFRIERNFICNNRMAGIGLMDAANTTEDLQGAALPELLLITHNTFVGNNCHVTGGANVLCANNIFTTATTVALRNIGGSSNVVNNLLWKNTSDAEATNSNWIRGESWPSIEATSTDPLLDAMFRPRSNSPVADTAILTVRHNQKKYTLQSPAQFEGAKPDLGAWELPQLRSSTRR